MFSIIRHNIPRDDLIPSEPPLPTSLSYLLNKNPPARTFRSFFPNTAVNIDDFQEIKVLNYLVDGQYDIKYKIEILNMWTLSFLSIDLKNYALFHFNNKNILNLYRARFSETSPECTFCRKFPTSNAVAVENFEHLYFSCPFVSTIINTYFLDLFDFTINIKEVVSRGSQLTSSINLIINVEALLFCFYISTQKSCNRIPTFSGFLYHAFNIKKQMLRCSPKYSKLYQNVCNKRGRRIIEYNHRLEFFR